VRGRVKRNRQRQLLAAVEGIRDPLIRAPARSTLARMERMEQAALNSGYRSVGHQQRVEAGFPGASFHGTRAEVEAGFGAPPHFGFNSKHLR
jgi:hypothetical protein